MPVRMNGTEPGMATVLKICQSEAQNARAARSRSGSRERMPATVFTRIGKNDEMKTTKTLDFHSVPNQMMIIGTIAIRGNAYRALRKGSKIRRILRYHPII